eukprot:c44716_g1_i1 orf=202-444(+)
MMDFKYRISSILGFLFNSGHPLFYKINLSINGNSCNDTRSLSAWVLAEEKRTFSFFLILPVRPYSSVVVAYFVFFCVVFS